VIVACGAPVDGAWCPACGLELGGEEPMRCATVVAARRGGSRSERRVARGTTSRRLASRRLQWVNVASGPPFPPAPSPFRPSPAPSVGEWNVERIRNVLLWLGATLLALSALTFTAVAWTHLGPAGRAVLLIALTALAGAGAVMSRDRRPATSGALTGLAIALALVDWQIVRRAGVAPGMSTTAWWAIGTAFVAAASLAFGRVAAPRPAQRAAVVLLPTAVVSYRDGRGRRMECRTRPVGFAALLLAADRAFLRNRPDALVRGSVRVEAASAWIAGRGCRDRRGLRAAAALRGNAGSGRGDVDLRLRRRWCLPGRPQHDRPRAVRDPRARTVPRRRGDALSTASVRSGCSPSPCSSRASGSWSRRPSTTNGNALQIVGAAVGTVGALVARVGRLAATSSDRFDAAWSGSLTATARDVVSGPNTTSMPILGWCAVAMLLAGGHDPARATTSSGSFRSALAVRIVSAAVASCAGARADRRVRPCACVRPRAARSLRADPRQCALRGGPDRAFGFGGSRCSRWPPPQDGPR
jgi:hypothetical protein